jgi:hypothetical protein
MCLVLFGWLTRQDYFKNLTERDVRLDIYADEIAKLEEDVLPFGAISTFDDDDNETPGWELVDNMN